MTRRRSVRTRLDVGVEVVSEDGLAAAVMFRDVQLVTGFKQAVQMVVGVAFASLVEGQVRSVTLAAGG